MVTQLPQEHLTVQGPGQESGTPAPEALAKIRRCTLLSTWAPSLPPSHSPQPWHPSWNSASQSTELPAGSTCLRPSARLRCAPCFSRAGGFPTGPVGLQSPQDRPCPLSAAGVPDRCLQPRSRDRSLDHRTAGAGRAETTERSSGRAAQTELCGATVAHWRKGLRYGLEFCSLFVCF